MTTTSDPFDVTAALREPGLSFSETRDRIMALGPAAAPALLAVLEEEVAEDGMACVAAEHAAYLLGELQVPEAVPLFIRGMAGSDCLSALHDCCLTACSAVGAAALEPVLEAYARTEDAETRMSLANVLSGLGVRDARVREVLLGILATDPDSGASALARYGDPAALPAVAAALDAYELGREAAAALADDAVIELVAAIEELGGEVSPSGLAKRRTVADAGRAMVQPLIDAGRRSAELESRPRRRPERRSQAAMHHAGAAAGRSTNTVICARTRAAETHRCGGGQPPAETRHVRSAERWASIRSDFPIAPNLRVVIHPEVSAETNDPCTPPRLLRRRPHGPALPRAS